jgi:hypothetical protein
MDSSYAATIEKQEMLLNERDDSSCTDSELVEVNHSDELAHSYQ